MASQPDPKAAIDPKAARDQAAKPKGVVIRSRVVKLADPAFIAQLGRAAPAGQIDIAVQQPFQGSEPAPPTRVEQAKAVAQSTKGVAPRGMRLSAKPAATDEEKAAPVEKPAEKRAPRVAAKPASDYQPRTYALDSEPEAEMRSELKEYRIKQDEIVGANPYVTDMVVYTPQTRKSFYNFIKENYSAFRLPHAEVGKAVDKNACLALEQKEGTQVDTFLYQEFVREYIRNVGPYRGILVYHGLGSGKTCSAIAAAEALYGTSNKRIIVMTPFSLRPNFMSEISFCGFRHFNVYNHWIPIKFGAGGIEYTYATTVLSLKPKYLTKILGRDDPERRVFWVPDFSKESNYKELAPEFQNEIREQLTHMIDSRIKFISYNGISAAELKRYACLPDPETGKPTFDDAVIVIDEVHNLSRLMQGQIMPYITEREGGARRKIDAEPIVPGRWEPKLCGKSENYKRAYLFYRLLTDARNSKIIGLSGTPIINFPEELGILANVLGGYIECAEFSLLSTRKEVMEKVKKLAEEEPRVDIVRFREGNQKMSVLISFFQEGYVRHNDENGVFDGVTYDEEAQESITTIYPRIKAKLLASNIKIEEDMKKGPYVSYPRLPIDDETFKRNFINPANSKIINAKVLKKRLAGLISYYKGSKEEYMPRVTLDKEEKCEMSDYVLLNKYTPARNGEIQGEIGKKKEKDDVFAAVEMFAKMKNPSSYRFRSRALCNFAFPENITRPFPGTDEEIAEEEKDIEVIPEDVQITEAIIDVDADRIAAEKVAEEEKQASDALVSDQAPAEQQGGDDSDEEYEEEDDEEYEEEEEEEEDDEEYEEEEEDDDDANNEAEENDFEGGEYDDMMGGMDPPVAASSELPKRKGPKSSVSKSALAAKAAAPSESSAPSEPVAVSESVAPSDLIESSKPVEPSASLAPSVVKRKGPPSSVSKTALAAKAAAKAEADAQAAKAQANMKAAKAVVAVDEEKKDVPRMSTYKEQIVKAMKELDQQRDSYLVQRGDEAPVENRLSTYSSKLSKMLNNIEKSKGSNLVYSQFKTVEGLGVLGVVLKANGYDEIVIEGTEQNPRFSEETLRSFAVGLGDVSIPKRKRFITFTGEGSKEQRALVLNIFNGHFDKLPSSLRAPLEPFRAAKNTTGDICWVIGITGAGAEGISLKCCRSVHIMEPYWNNVRLDQVKGRAIRICSHKDLPFKDRTVDIYTYYTVFSPDQLKSEKIDMTIRSNDNNETSDEKVYYVSKRKDEINQEILKVMKESAVDCDLNLGENGKIQCFEVNGRPTQYLFDPNLEIDISITTTELEEDKPTKDSRLSQALDGVSAEPNIERIKVTRIKQPEFEGKDYLRYEYNGTMYIFDRNDAKCTMAIGEFIRDPALNRFIGAERYSQPRKIAK